MRRNEEGCWEVPKEYTPKYITLELLQAAAPYTSDKASVFVPHLNTACIKYDITTPERIAMFIAQLAHESGSFKYMREIASGKAYEGRADLGNTEKGDGVRYKGRGPIQITGKNNYRLVSIELFGDHRLLNNPDLLATPEYGCLSAGWYWHTKNLNKWADKKDIKGVTKRINGGYNGLTDRTANYQRALQYLGITE